MRDPEDLRRLSQELLYEVQMLFGSSTALEEDMNAAVEPPHERTMALIESFAIHSRALIHFLWRDTGRADDALAGDYFEPGRWATLRPTMETTLHGLDQRVGGYIAHLSFKRTRVTADERWWRHKQIAASIGRCLRVFIQNVADEVVAEHFRSRAWYAMFPELQTPIAMSWPADDIPGPVATQPFPHEPG